MAVKYFDDKTRDAAVNHQRQQKTIDAFNRLPEDFTVEDVMRCFDIVLESSARTKIARLIADNLAVKANKIVENGRAKVLYHKKHVLILWP